MILFHILENAPTVVDGVGQFASMAAGGAATGGLVSYLLGNRIIERLVKLETQMEALLAARIAQNEEIRIVIESEIRKHVKPESIR